MRKRIIICLLVLALLIFGLFFVFRSNTIKELKKGYLLYSNHSIKKICVYDIENSVETSYYIDEFPNILSVDKYYGGDFCCVEENSQPGGSKMLLFKDGIIEANIYVPYKALFAVAYDQHIYFSTETELFFMDKNTGECIFIDHIYSRPYINSNGIVTYLRNDTDLTSTEEYFKNTLCYYKNGEIIELGDASRIVCWLSENELVVEKCKTVVTEYEKHITTEYISQNYIVNVDARTFEETHLFKETVLSANLSEDKSKAVCWFPMDGSTDSMYLGLVNVTDYKLYKRAIGQSSLNSMPATFLRLDENPLKKYEINQSNNSVTIR